jgi:hypothetical protein
MSFVWFLRVNNSYVLNSILKVIFVMEKCCEIWGFHDSEDDDILGFGAV